MGETNSQGRQLDLRNVHKTSASIEYRVRRDQQDVLKLTDSSEQLNQNGEQITIERLLPLGGLSPGHYKLEVVATDQLTNQTISRSAEFTVKPAEEKTAAKKSPGR